MCSVAPVKWFCTPGSQGCCKHCPGLWHKTQWCGHFKACFPTCGSNYGITSFTGETPPSPTHLFSIEKHSCFRQPQLCPSRSKEVTDTSQARKERTKKPQRFSTLTRFSLQSLVFKTGGRGRHLVGRTAQGVLKVIMNPPLYV